LIFKKNHKPKTAPKSISERIRGKTHRAPAQSFFPGSRWGGWGGGGGVGGGGVVWGGVIEIKERGNQICQGTARGAAERGTTLWRAQGAKPFLSEEVGKQH